MSDSKKNSEKSIGGVGVEPLVILHHPNCRNDDCEICLNDHYSLGELLDEKCETGNRIDHLGKMHLWMTRSGLQAETEWGWATPQTFKKSNIDAYVQAYKNGEL